MLQVVCEASPQHFHLRLCQTPHMKLPQPQLALDPCVTKLHDSSRTYRALRQHLLDSLGESRILLACLGECASMGKQMDLLQGTLDMLILKAASLGPLHGYGVLLRIQQISKDRLEIQQGSLYPALYRLEHQGWITSEWGESENKRKAKYYRLTAAGRRKLQTEAEKWNRMADVIAGILQSKPEEV